MRVERITREAFAPFGDLLSPLGIEPLADASLYQGVVDVYRPAFFEADGSVEYLLTKMRLREFRVLYLERHPELTQMIVPLGSPFILVVARPEAREEDGIPAFDEIRAFLVPPTAGIGLKRGTWHEAPFPFEDGTLVLYTSTHSLTEAFRSGFNESQEVDVVDLEKRNVTERAGYVLRVEFP